MKRKREPWELVAFKFLRALEARCGEDGFHFIVAADNFEPFDGEEQNGESDIVADPVRRIGLERMAAGLRASQPGMKVRINPPGHRKVSEDKASNFCF